MITPLLVPYLSHRLLYGDPCFELEYTFGSLDYDRLVNGMNYKSTVKASVRHLTRHALDKPGDGEPGETTKTLKFRVDAHGHTRTRLDQIFTAQRRVS